MEINRLTGGKHLTGVYPADRLPKICKKPIAVIVHSEVASVTVGHWIAIYAPKKGPVQYFDSFGLKPQVESHIKFLHRLRGKIIFNDVCYQSLNSITCGGYALLFLCSKIGYIKSLKKNLTRDTEKNDRFIKISTEALVENLGL